MCSLFLSHQQSAPSVMALMHPSRFSMLVFDTTNVRDVRSKMLALCIQVNKICKVYMYLYIYKYTNTHIIQVVMLVIHDKPSIVSTAEMSENFRKRRKSNSKKNPQTID